MWGKSPIQSAVERRATEAQVVLGRKLPLVSSASVSFLWAFLTFIGSWTAVATGHWREEHVASANQRTLATGVTTIHRAYPHMRQHPKSLLEAVHQDNFDAIFEVAREINLNFRTPINPQLQEMFQRLERGNDLTAQALANETEANLLKAVAVAAALEVVGDILAAARIT